MELLDRYLNAVRFLLPRAQQDDIIAELREDLCQKIEDRESQLGRKLTEDELAAILKDRGQPMLVAARYAPQQQLIGPVLLPIYTFVLKLVVLWILLPVFALIVGPVLAFTSPNPSVALLHAIWDLVMGAIFSVGLITLIFAVLERFPDQLNKWDPRKLPKMGAMADVAALRMQCRPKATSRVKGVSEIFASLIALPFVTYVVWFHPNLAFGTDTVQATLAPIWRTMFWPILLVFLGGMTAGLVTVVWPADTQVRSILRIATQTFSLIVACVLLSAGPWIILASHTVPAAGLAEATKWTNIGIQIGIGVTVVMNVIEIGLEAFRLFRTRSIPASHFVA